MIRAAERVFSGEKYAMTGAANWFDRAMLRLAERLLRNNIRFRGFVYTRVREFAPTRSRKCDKYATLGQNPGQYTATMRRKLCAVIDQMLTLSATRPASQRVGLSEVPGNQGWAGLRARGTQMSRIRSSFALLAGCAVALGFGGTAALAADMGLPTKAAPMVAAAPPPLDIHGFVEFDWESTLINPNGQVLGTHGAEFDGRGPELDGLPRRRLDQLNHRRRPRRGGLGQRLPGRLGAGLPDGQWQLLRLGRCGHRVSHVLEFLDVERTVHDGHFPGRRRNRLRCSPPAAGLATGSGLCRSTN